MKESATSRHLTREELIALARRPRASHPDHLRECDDCRLAFELLTVFDTSGRSPLPKPSESWIKRAAAIADADRVPSVLKRLKARLTYDSWLTPQPVGVRGTSSTAYRRIEFESQGRILDLRAERNKEGWVFVAQLSGASGTNNILVCGRQTVWPDDNNLFQWTSVRPPRKISVRIDNELIDLPDLKWTKPSSRKQRGDS